MLFHLLWSLGQITITELVYLMKHIKKINLRVNEKYMDDQELIRIIFFLILIGHGVLRKEASE